MFFFKSFSNSFESNDVVSSKIDLQQQQSFLKEIRGHQCLRFISEYLQQQRKPIQRELQPYLRSVGLTNNSARFLQLARADGLALRSALKHWSGDIRTFSTVCPMCQCRDEDLVHFISECPSYNAIRLYYRNKLWSELIRIFKLQLSAQKKLIHGEIQICYHDFLSQWMVADALEFVKLVLCFVAFKPDSICDKNRKLIYWNNSYNIQLQSAFVTIVCRMLITMYQYRSSQQDIHSVNNLGRYSLNKKFNCFVEDIQPMDKQLKIFSQNRIHVINDKVNGLLSDGCDVEPNRQR